MHNWRGIDTSAVWLGIASEFACKVRQTLRDTPHPPRKLGTYCPVGSPSCSRARSKISWHRLLKMNLCAISDLNEISNWVILWSEVNMKIKTWIRFEIHLNLLSLHSDLNQTWKFYNVVYVPLKYLWPWLRIDSDFNIR